MHPVFEGLRGRQESLGLSSRAPGPGAPSVQLAQCFPHLGPACRLGGVVGGDFARVGIAPAQRARVQKEGSDPGDRRSAVEIVADERVARV